MTSNDTEMELIKLNIFPALFWFPLWQFIIWNERNIDRKLFEWKYELNFREKLSISNAVKVSIIEGIFQMGPSLYITNIAL